MSQTNIIARPLLPPGMTTAVAAVGAVAIGAALFEAVLVPGLIIGGAVVLGPRLLPGLRRRISPARPKAATSVVTRFGLKQAVVKTITFRTIATSLDFATNYLIIGKLSTAAGLSAFSLVAGPVFYLLHETLWTRYGPAAKAQTGVWANRIDVPMTIPSLPGSTATSRKGRNMNRTVAKTITYSLFSVSMGFTTNYVAVRDVGTAVLLTATGVVLGPLVYFGHELAWDRYSTRQKPRLETTALATVP